MVNAQQSGGGTIGSPSDLLHLRLVADALICRRASILPRAT